MTNITLLEQKIEESGLKINYIAQKMGISRESLLNKRKGLTGFTQDNIKVLSNLLELSSKEVSDIFFA